jgi:hypothetical protein
MVDRHYSLNLKPCSARTIYVYAHADLAQKYSVGLQEIFVSRLFFPALVYTIFLATTIYDCVNMYTIVHG